MKKIFNPKITPGPWALPKNKLGQELVPVWAVRDLENTEEIKSLNRKELIFNLFEDDERAFLAIPEMNEVIQAVQRWYQTNYRDKRKIAIALEGIEQTFEVLLEKHGTEAE